MKRILVTGASGFLGWNLYQQRPKGVEWFGTYHRHPIELPGVDVHPLDLNKQQDIHNLLQWLNPDVVIHTAAMSNAHWCERHPNQSEAINVAGAVALATACADQGCSFVFVSSDLVFDGNSPPYKPGDPPKPLSLYAKQKARAEEEIRQAYAKATIVRAPLMFGLDGPNSSNMLSRMIRQWKAGERLPLFTDEYRTPADGKSVAQGLYIAASHPGAILHLGGPARISRYDFGLLLVESFDLPKSQLKPLRQSELDLPAPRPKDVSLDSSASFALGYYPSDLKEALSEIAAKWIKRH